MKIEILLKEKDAFLLILNYLVKVSEVENIIIERYLLPGKNN
jgi:hypothetical protein